MNTTPQDPADSAEHSDRDTAKRAAGDIGHEAKATAREIGDKVADQARDRAEAVRDGAAGEIAAVSDALRRASEELRQGSPQQRAFGAVADAAADFAGSLRDRDLGDMVDDLGQFARRTPVGFLGGAALLGFAGARLAKASRRARQEDDGDDTRHDHHTGQAPAAVASRADTGPANTPATNRTGETS